MNYSASNADRFTLDPETGEFFMDKDGTLTWAEANRRSREIQNDKEAKVAAGLSLLGVSREEAAAIMANVEAEKAIAYALNGYPPVSAVGCLTPTPLPVGASLDPEPKETPSPAKRIDDMTLLDYKRAFDDPAKAKRLLGW